MADFSKNQGRVALMLRTPDGCPWELTMTAGIETFIGRYRRIEEFARGSGLIRFSYVETSGSPPAASDNRL